MVLCLNSKSPTEITGVRGKFPVATIAVLLQSTLGSVDGSVYYTYISKSGMGFAIAAKYWSIAFTNPVWVSVLKQITGPIVFKTR